MSRKFDASEAYLERAEATIPLGSQTFSKSRTQYPVGASPLFLVRGKGATVWDLDGHSYTDFVSGLAAITLGYGDPDVDAAVRAQLDDGVLFSLPHPIEAEVAELICDMVPSAESVRFGKNGSDATAGAVRVARAFTGNDHIIVCGYHGWQDWYIGSTARHRGVPATTRALTHAVAFNDLDTVRSILDQHAVAAIILEPMNTTFPAEGYLEGLKSLAADAGALLIFDETITGFRFHNGGAQALFGVTPDLSCFGKGLANGFPLSAVVGRADVMAQMEEVFFSFTMGGETLSLAAAKATLNKLRAEPVVDHLTSLGRRLLDRLEDEIQAHQLGDVFGTAGHPTWSFLTIKDTVESPMMTTKTLVMQELHQAGFLSVGSHNLTYAHTVEDIDALLSTYESILPKIARAARQGTVLDHLTAKPLVPLFKVR